MKKKKKLPIITSMKCDDHCGDCCGIVPCSESEFKRIQAYIAEHKIVPVEQGVTCPLYIRGKCSVYEVRPMICQIFGHTPKLKCSHGYNVDDLSTGEIDKLFQSTGNQVGARHTHDVLPGPTLLERGSTHFR